jgi:polyketide synthase 13
MPANLAALSIPLTILTSGSFTPFPVCSVAPGRISFHMGLSGPSMAVDTACSSSLVATSLAVQHIRTTLVPSSEPSSSLVGGVNMMLLPGTTAMFSQAGEKVGAQAI